MGGGGVTYTASKVWCRNGILFGAAGASGVLEAFKTWSREGQCKGPAPDADDCSLAVIITPQGEILQYYHPYWSRVTAEFAAWGSGADIARGAMAMGADAITAVAVAAVQCRAT